jgi:hypothetical protein
LNSCRFTRFASPVLRSNPSSKLSLSVLHSLVRKAKALSQSIPDEEPPDTPCRTVKGTSLDHQLLFHHCIDFKNCQFLNCSSEKLGGAIDANRCNLTFLNCIFEKGFAEYGGAIYAIKMKIFVITSSTIIDSHADRFGGIYAATKWQNFTTVLVSTNISYCYADIYIGGIRVETTTPKLFDVGIVNAYAPKYGGVWDWSTMDSVAIYTGCRFVNCSSENEGASLTLFHWLHRSIITKCLFARGKGKAPKYIYVYSTEAVVRISESWFDATQNVSIGDRFGNNSITIAESNHFEPDGSD